MSNEIFKVGERVSAVSKVLGVVTDGIIKSVSQDGASAVLDDGISLLEVDLSTAERRGVYKYATRVEVKVNRYGREEVRFYWRDCVYHDAKAVAEGVAVWERENGRHLDFCDIERGRVSLFVKRVAA